VVTVVSVVRVSVAGSSVSVAGELRQSLRRIAGVFGVTRSDGGSVMASSVVQIVVAIVVQIVVWRVARSERRGLVVR